MISPLAPLCCQSHNAPQVCCLAPIEKEMKDLLMLCPLHSSRQEKQHHVNWINKTYNFQTLCFPDFQTEICGNMYFFVSLYLCRLKKQQVLNRDINTTKIWDGLCKITGTLLSLNNLKTDSNCLKIYWKRSTYWKSGAVMVVVAGL